MIDRRPIVPIEIARFSSPQEFSETTRHLAGRGALSTNRECGSGLVGPVGSAWGLEVHFQGSWRTKKSELFPSSRRAVQTLACALAKCGEAGFDLWTGFLSWN